MTSFASSPPTRPPGGTSPPSCASASSRTSRRPPPSKPSPGNSPKPRATFVRPCERCLSPMNFAAHAATSSSSRCTFSPRRCGSPMPKRDVGRPLVNYLVRMGHMPFEYPAPDGYPAHAEPWMSTLLWRWNFAAKLAQGQHQRHAHPARTFGQARRRPGQARRPPARPPAKRRRTRHRQGVRQPNRAAALQPGFPVELTDDETGQGNPPRKRRPAANARRGIPARRARTASRSCRRSVMTTTTGRAHSPPSAKQRRSNWMTVSG